jgi:hypothetical protein
MNTNAFKTLIQGSGLLIIVGPYLLNFVLGMFGCTGDNPLTSAVEVAVCTGGSLFTIPAGLQTLVGGLVIAGALALTAFFKSGTIKQNLINPSVPVVPANDPTSGPGNVTPAQVASK